MPAVPNVFRLIVMFALSALLALFALLALPAVNAQERVPRPPLVLDSLGGRDNFERYCAPCHGVDGRGHGPVAPSLKTTPSDLTLLSRLNGGLFPRERVTAIVTGVGREPDVHGSAEMPVWGVIFRGLDPSDVRTKVRVDNVVSHVESLQATRTGGGE